MGPWAIMVSKMKNDPKYGDGIIFTAYHWKNGPFKQLPIYISVDSFDADNISKTAIGIWQVVKECEKMMHDLVHPILSKVRNFLG